MIITIRHLDHLNMAAIESVLHRRIPVNNDLVVKALDSPIQESQVQNREVAPTLTRPFIFLLSINYGPGTPGN